MKFLQISTLFVLLSGQGAFAQGYFFFGNINLVGTGKMVGKSKEGVWKVYGRKVELDNPGAAVAAVTEEEVQSDFNLAFPLYQLEFTNNQLDGLFEEFYPEGSTKKVVNYQRGMLHGDFFEFSKSGELLLSGTYFEGEKTGDWFVYRSDGGLRSEYSYRKNVLVGTAISYFPSGQVDELIPFDEGQLDGVYESFFYDGSPRQRVTFLKGKEEGEYRQFHAGGSLAILANFSNGILDGQFEEYTSNGDLLAIGNYQQGERTGKWREVYAELPTFSHQGDYLVGAKNGAWQVIGSDGFIHQEEYFKDGVLVAISEFTTRDGGVLVAGSLTDGDGRRIFYDEDGNRLEKGRYAKGLRTGTWFTYFPQTNLVATSGTYAEGKKRGTWKQYDFQGQLVSEQVVGSDQSHESERISSIQTPDSQSRSRFYPSSVTNRGMVNSQVLVTTPDGTLGISVPGIFQQWR